MSKEIKISKLKNVKILITGGAGFIGTHLTKALLKEGAKVTIYDRNLIKITHPHLTSIQDSLDGKTSLEKIIGKYDLIIHLASKIGSGELVVNRKDFLLTLNLLEAMKKSKRCKTFLFASSSAIYGKAKIPTPENRGSLEPISLYGASKLASEAFISAYSHLFNLRMIVVRFANVIGPNMKRGVIFDFIQKLRKNPKLLEILGTGKQRKSYIYIEDVIDALLLLLKKKKEKNLEIFNIGTEDTISVKDIAKLVVREMNLTKVTFAFLRKGGKKIKNKEFIKADVSNMLLDISKIKKLGWFPRYSSEKAVRKTIRELIR